MNFKSKGAYKKWLAFGHMHVKDFGKTPQKISIRGKAHKVDHGFYGHLSVTKSLGKIKGGLHGPC